MSYIDRVKVTLLPPYIQGDPEVAAMLGAFYSRSPMPIEERLADLGDDLSSIKTKLGNVVVGYGHNSVLDMANIAIFIERIPILAAVAIENHALFSGQETSSRYVDWSKAEFCNPFSDGPVGALYAVHEYLRETYVAVQDGVLQRLKDEHPSMLTDDDDGRAALRAMKARSFDVARGFLPSSAVTNVCWSGRLSSILQHVKALLIHPDPTVVEVTYKIYAALRERFPEVVVPPTEFHSEDDEHRADYWPGSMPVDGYGLPTLTVTGEMTADLAGRSRKQRVPPRCINETVAKLEGAIDYGSFRDLNRHRVGYKDVRPPMLVASLHPWYVNMASELLPSDFTDKLHELQTAYVEAYDASHEAAKFDGLRRDHMLAYAAPLGCVVPVYYRMDLGQFVYLSELRSGLDVHPTLRMLILGANVSGRACLRKYPITIHLDNRPDPGPAGFVLSRGNQTILIQNHELL